LIIPIFGDCRDNVEIMNTRNFLCRSFEAVLRRSANCLSSPYSLPDFFDPRRRCYFQTVCRNSH